MKNETINPDTFSYCNPSSNRPISAMIKRPIFGMKCGTVSFKAKTKADFPTLFSTTSCEYFHDTKGLGKAVEREQLYEETLQLKSIINRLQKELAAVKSENVKKEQEINKKDKVIEDIAVDSQHYVGDSSTITMDKAKDMNLIIKIKKQYKQLKSDYNVKCNESECLKRQMKLTKINEMTIETKMLSEELSKMKELYLHSLHQNEINENNLKNMSSLQDSFSKQHFIIISLQENIAKLNEEMKKKDEEIFKLKDKSSNDANSIKKHKKDIKNLNQINEKMTKEKKECDEFLSVKASYEQKISDLSTELATYKDLVNRSEKIIRELQSKQKNSPTTLNNPSTSVKPFNYNEIKYIQDNPEDKSDSKILLLKSLLQETLNSKAELEKRNREYEERLRLLGASVDTSGKTCLGAKKKLIVSNDFPRNDEREQVKKEIPNPLIENENENENDPIQTKKFTSDQLTEFTYILIKNFEAKHITKEIAIEKIVRELFENVSDSNKIEKDEMINNLTKKVCALLKLKNSSDNTKINIFLTSLFTASDSNLQIFLEKFISLFLNVRTFTQSEELHLTKKIKKHMTSSSEYLLDSLKAVDKNSTGYVSFVNLRNILENGKIKLKDKYIEYLIYLMKKHEDENSSIYDLKYDLMFKIFNDTTHDSKMNEASMNDDDDQANVNPNEESEEIVITSDQYIETINQFFIKLATLLEEKKSSIRELFRNLIFSTELPDGKGKCDVINIKSFAGELKKYKIDLNTLQIYCIYDKLKVIDGFEAVSVISLENELNSFNSNKFNMTKPGPATMVEKGVTTTDCEKKDSMEKVPEVVDEEYSGYEFDKMESNEGFISNRIDDVKEKGNIEDCINIKNNRPTTSKPKKKK